VARPKKRISGKQVLQLAAKGMVAGEIGASLGCSDELMRSRFLDEYERGQKLSDASLRRKQVQRALGGSDNMLIHLGKNRLG
jgi:hypothetical protein